MQYEDSGALSRRRIRQYVALAPLMLDAGRKLFRHHAGMGLLLPVSDTCKIAKEHIERGWTTSPPHAVCGKLPYKSLKGGSADHHRPQRIHIAKTLDDELRAACISPSCSVLRAALIVLLFLIPQSGCFRLSPTISSGRTATSTTCLRLSARRGLRVVTVYIDGRHADHSDRRSTFGTARADCPAC